jgi:hypothetical protein
VHFKSVFTEANLFLLVERQMMPAHFHGNLSAVLSAEKFMEFSAPAIVLFIWRLDINRIFAETIRGFVRVTFILSIRDGLHQLFKIRFCHR